MKNRQETHRNNSNVNNKPSNYRISKSQALLGLTAGMLAVGISSAAIANDTDTKEKTPEQVEKALSSLLTTKSTDEKPAPAKQVPTATTMLISTEDAIAPKSQDHSEKSVSELIMAGLAITSEAKSELSEEQASTDLAIPQEATPAPEVMRDYAVEDITSVSQLSDDVEMQMSSALETAVQEDQDEKDEVEKDEASEDEVADEAVAKDEASKDDESTEKEEIVAKKAEEQKSDDMAEETAPELPALPAPILEAQAKEKELEKAKETLAVEELVTEVEAQEADAKALAAEVESQEADAQALAAEVESQEADAQALAAEVESQEADAQALAAEVESQEAAAQALAAETERQETAAQALAAETERQETAAQALAAETERQEAAAQALAVETERQEAAAQALAAEAKRKEAAAQELAAKAESQEAAAQELASEIEAEVVEAVLTENNEFIANEPSSTEKIDADNKATDNTPAVSAEPQDQIGAKVEVAIRAEGCPESFNNIDIPVNGKLCQIFAADFPASMILHIPQTPEEVVNYYLASSDKFVEPKTIKSRTMLKSVDNNTTLIISKDGNGTQVDILVKQPII
ncbi:hypothetical protein ISG33_16125 [Glaciecola sp. MH2013]|uniref:hypothetical protein n=1 Tax=Glaciecola sp. MH2013 TaxID=2785524 RepID=UPI00189EB71F|nr:hypothetical protein [Glaciecola sp. MH2013]MBF7074930.1 hypothetical protein [Glaciecola sp. MH2013]